MASQDNHPPDFNLCGKLLLAMPSMGDPRFQRAVILICAHDENGAMGLVINNPLANVSFSHLLQQLGIISDIEVDLSAPQQWPVMNGGPVETSRGFILHSSDFKRTGTVRVDNNFSISGTIDALKECARGRGPKDALFILGYAGWGSGQIEQELQQNAWLMAEPDPAVIFHKAPDVKWGLAVNSLGFDPAMLSLTTGSA
jgi:putative transcriptional regulator